MKKKLITLNVKQKRQETREAELSAAFAANTNGEEPALNAQHYDLGRRADQKYGMSCGRTSLDQLRAL